MKHHRLKHAANTLCHMFGGWRLANSQKEVERLGSGVLAIEVITAACKFNGSSVEPLTIAQEMQAWFLRDLELHHIPVKQILTAVLEANMEVAIGNNPRRDFFFTKDGKSIKSGPFVRLHARCRCEIATDETSYVSEHEFSDAWPLGWPER
jgi:hypothetical protein